VKLWLTPAVVLMFLSLGCGSTTPVLRVRSLSVDEVVLRVRQRDHSVSTLKGEGSITVESPEASNSGSFEAELKKPDSLRVELRGPFGIHIGTLLLSNTQFLFYNWRDNTTTSGKPDGSTLKSMFRIALQFDEVFNVFTGEFLSIAGKDSLLNFSVQNDLYVLRYRTEDGVKEYRVDGDAFIVTSYRLLDSTGKAKVIAIASRLDHVSDTPMPKLLRIILPNERRSVTIAYGDININNEVHCSFTPPQQAEHISH
jgi:outer membrane lipoprotein-sorting protein